MVKRSKSSGKATFPQIKVGGPARTIRINADNLETHLNVEHVSISLRYFQRSCECFSKWEKPELKKFSATIDKLLGYGPNLLTKTSSLCVMHKDAPDEDRFSLPDEISPEQALHEIKVDPSNKLRIHGFFSGPVFFLLWLDREHACFKEK